MTHVITYMGDTIAAIWRGAQVIYWVDSLSMAFDSLEDAQAAILGMMETR